MEANSCTSPNVALTLVSKLEDFVSSVFRETLDEAAYDLRGRTKADEILDEHALWSDFPRRIPGFADQLKHISLAGRSCLSGVIQLLLEWAPIRSRVYADYFNLPIPGPGPHKELSFDNFVGRMGFRLRTDPKVCEYLITGISLVVADTIAYLLLEYSGPNLSNAQLHALIDVGFEHLLVPAPKKAVSSTWNVVWREVTKQWTVTFGRLSSYALSDIADAFAYRVNEVSQARSSSTPSQIAAFLRSLKYLEWDPLVHSTLYPEMIGNILSAVEGPGRNRPAVRRAGCWALHSMVQAVSPSATDQRLKPVHEQIKRLPETIEKWIRADEVRTDALRLLICIVLHSEVERFEAQMPPLMFKRLLKNAVKDSRKRESLRGILQVLSGTYPQISGARESWVPDRSIFDPEPASDVGAGEPAYSGSSQRLASATQERHRSMLMKAGKMTDSSDDLLAPAAAAGGPSGPSGGDDAETHGESGRRAVREDEDRLIANFCMGQGAQQPPGKIAIKMAVANLPYIERARYRNVSQCSFVTREGETMQARLARLQQINDILFDPRRPLPRVGDSIDDLSEIVLQMTAQSLDFVLVHTIPTLLSASHGVAAMWLVGLRALKVALDPLSRFAEKAGNARQNVESGRNYQSRLQDLSQAIGDLLPPLLKICESNAGVDAKGVNLVELEVTSYRLEDKIAEVAQHWRRYRRRKSMLHETTPSPQRPQWRPQAIEEGYEGEDDEGGETEYDSELGPEGRRSRGAQRAGPASASVTPTAQTKGKSRANENRNLFVLVYQALLDLLPLCLPEELRQHSHTLSRLLVHSNTGLAQACSHALQRIVVERPEERHFFVDGVLSHVINRTSMPAANLTTVLAHACALVHQWAQYAKRSGSKVPFLSNASGDAGLPTGSRYRKMQATVEGGIGVLYKAETAGLLSLCVSSTDIRALALQLVRSASALRKVLGITEVSSLYSVLEKDQTAIVTSAFQYLRAVSHSLCGTPFSNAGQGELPTLYAVATGEDHTLWSYCFSDVVRRWASDATGQGLSIVREAAGKTLRALASMPCDSHEQACTLSLLVGSCTTGIEEPSSVDDAMVDANKTIREFGDFFILLLNNNVTFEGCIRALGVTHWEAFPQMLSVLRPWMDATLLRDKKKRRAVPRSNLPEVLRVLRIMSEGTRMHHALAYAPQTTLSVICPILKEAFQSLQWDNPVAAELETYIDAVALTSALSRAIIKTLQLEADDPKGQSKLRSPVSSPQQAGAAGAEQNEAAAQEAEEERPVLEIVRDLWASDARLRIFDTLLPIGSIVGRDQDSKTGVTTLNVFPPTTALGILQASIDRTVSRIKDADLRNVTRERLLDLTRSLCRAVLLASGALLSSTADPLFRGHEDVVAGGRLEWMLSMESAAAAKRALVSESEIPILDFVKYTLRQPDLAAPLLLELTRKSVESVDHSLARTLCDAVANAPYNFSYSMAVQSNLTQMPESPALVARLVRGIEPEMLSYSLWLINHPVSVDLRRSGLLLLQALLHPCCARLCSETTGLTSEREDFQTQRLDRAAEKLTAATERHTHVVESEIYSLRTSSLSSLLDSIVDGLCTLAPDDSGELVDAASTQRWDAESFAVAVSSALFQTISLLPRESPMAFASYLWICKTAANFLRWVRPVRKPEASIHSQVPGVLSIAWDVSRELTNLGGSVSPEVNDMWLSLSKPPPAKDSATNDGCVRNLIDFIVNQVANDLADVPVGGLAVVPEGDEAAASAADDEDAAANQVPETQPGAEKERNLTRSLLLAMEIIGDLLREQGQAAAKALAFYVSPAYWREKNVRHGRRGSRASSLHGADTEDHSPHLEAQLEKPAKEILGTSSMSPVPGVRLPDAAAGRPSEAGLTLVSKFVSRLDTGEKPRDEDEDEDEDDEEDEDSRLFVTEDYGDVRELMRDDRFHHSRDGRITAPSPQLVAATYILPDVLSENLEAFVPHLAEVVAYAAVWDGLGTEREKNNAPGGSRRFCMAVRHLLVASLKSAIVKPGIGRKSPDIMLLLRILNPEYNVPFRWPRPSSSFPVLKQAKDSLGQLPDKPEIVSELPAHMLIPVLSAAASGITLVTRNQQLGLSIEDLDDRLLGGQDDEEKLASGSALSQSSLATFGETALEWALACPNLSVRVHGLQLMGAVGLPSNHAVVHKLIAFLISASYSGMNSVTLASTSALQCLCRTIGKGLQNNLVNYPAILYTAVTLLRSPETMVYRAGVRLLQGVLTHLPSVHAVSNMAAAGPGAETADTVTGMWTEGWSPQSPFVGIQPLLVPGLFHKSTELSTVRILGQLVRVTASKQPAEDMSRSIVSRAAVEIVDERPSRFIVSLVLLLPRMCIYLDKGENEPIAKELASGLLSGIALSTAHSPTLEKLLTAFIEDKFQGHPMAFIVRVAKLLADSYIGSSNVARAVAQALLKLLSRGVNAYRPHVLRLVVCLLSHTRAPSYADHFVDIVRFVATKYSNAHAGRLLGAVCRLPFDPSAAAAGGKDEAAAADAAPSESSAPGPAALPAYEVGPSIVTIPEPDSVMALPTHDEFISSLVALQRSIALLEEADATANNEGQSVGLDGFDATEFEDDRTGHVLRGSVRIVPKAKTKAAQEVMLDIDRVVQQDARHARPVKRSAMELQPSPPSAAALAGSPSSGSVNQESAKPSYARMMMARPGKAASAVPRAAEAADETSADDEIDEDEEESGEGFSRFEEMATAADKQLPVLIPKEEPPVFSPEPVPRDLVASGVSRSGFAADESQIKAAAASPLPLPPPPAAPQSHGYGPKTASLAQSFSQESLDSFRRMGILPESSAADGPLPRPPVPPVGGGGGGSQSSLTGGIVMDSGDIVGVASRLSEPAKPDKGRRSRSPTRGGAGRGAADDTGSQFARLQRPGASAMQMVETPPQGLAVRERVSPADHAMPAAAAAAPAAFEPEIQPPAAAAVQGRSDAFAEAREYSDFAAMQASRREGFESESPALFGAQGLGVSVTSQRPFSVNLAKTRGQPPAAAAARPLSMQPDLSGIQSDPAHRLREPGGQARVSRRRGSRSERDSPSMARGGVPSGPPPVIQKSVAVPFSERPNNARGAHSRTSSKGSLHSQREAEQQPPQQLQPAAAAATATPPARAHHRRIGAAVDVDSPPVRVMRMQNAVSRKVPRAGYATSAVSLDRVLANPNLQAYLRMFLERVDPDDGSVDFYNSVQIYKEETSVQKAAVSAQMLIERFIASGGFNSVPIPENVREEVLYHFQQHASDPPIALFQAPLQKVIVHLRREVWPQFMASDEYRQMTETAGWS